VQKNGEYQPSKAGQCLVEGIGRKVTKVESQNSSPGHSPGRKLNSTHTGKSCATYCKNCNVKVQGIMQSAQVQKSPGQGFQNSKKLYQTNDFDEAE
jgi:hypothetical protein